MNILIISGSPRKGGNTELLVDAFAKGAAAHHHVEIVSVRDYMAECSQVSPKATHASRQMVSALRRMT